VEELMKIQAICCLAALVVPILFCRNGYPIDDEHSRDSLRGLAGITLVVEPPDRQVERDGLNLAFIRAAAEVKLRSEGIPVFSIEETPQWLTAPLLYINANVVKLGVGDYVYNVLVEFRQEVTLVRSPSVKFPAATWSTACVGRTTDLRDVLKTVQEGVAKFTTAYLSVNPKK
jgi:hypothetical protein